MTHCVQQCARRVYFKIMHIKRLLNKILTGLLVTGISSIALTGCGTGGEKRPEYMDASVVKALEIPPKLTRPNTQGALKLPEPSDKAKLGKNEVIAPVFTGMEIKNNSHLYWLEINEPVSEVWQKIPKFLSAEGIAVDRVEKLLGFVDTEWMNEYKVTYNAEEDSNGWFSGFSPDYKDRFRIRIEAVPGEDKTRMFVSHRGLQISVENDVSEWVQRDSEPFLEREILYRYVLFNGIEKTRATELLALYNSYQPRVNRVSDTDNTLTVKGEVTTVWQRLQMAVDRLGVDTLSRDQVNNSMKVRVGNLHVEEEPKEDETGWFSGLFSGKDVDVDDSEEFEDSAEYQVQPEKVAEEDEIILVLSLLSGKYSTIVKINNEDGSDISSHLALVFRDALLKELK